MAIVKEKYSVEKDKKSIKTKFSAKLEFKNNISPNEREEVRNRLYYERSLKKSEKIINYLESEGWDSYISVGFGYKDYFYRNGVKMEIKSSKRKISLEILAKADGEVPRESIINTEDLNNFVLQGNSP